ncbi:helix-turn-helix domain-containing protein [Stenotrophomonas maltophilia]|uniref:helix-turn-helix domain-containing protein n=2 Tax=Stenotrophomonas TaxID=40323 RepID=UPI0039C2640C
MDRIPQLLDQDESMRLGVSTLAEGLGAPLSFGSAYLVLLVCVSGRARFALNFREIALQRYDVLVLAEDTLALVRQRSRGFLAMACLLPKALASEVAYVLPDTLLTFLREQPHCVPSPLDVPLLQGWLHQLMDAQHNSGRQRHVMLRNLLQNFFLKMVTLLPKQKRAPAQVSRRQRLAWDFWERVGQRSTHQRDVQSYAEALCISPFYLSQLTRECFNATPKALIDRQVVLEIKALLTYSELPIGRIAERLNFEDASYLCRYFRRHTGQSLTGYRRAGQGGTGP